MENSTKMHSGKGKVSKGNVGNRTNTAISATISAKDNGQKETKDANKEKEDLRKAKSSGKSQRGGPDNGRKEIEDANKEKEDSRKAKSIGKSQRGGLALVCIEDDKHSDEERDEEEENAAVDKSGGSRKRPASKGKKTKIYQFAKDVDVEISNLKPPPRTLTQEDFAKEYNLCNESQQNPHCYRKGSFPTKLVRKYFREPVGEGGQNGFSWQQCEHVDLRARI